MPILLRFVTKPKCAYIQKTLSLITISSFSTIIDFNMATLTEVSVVARKVIKFGAIALVVLILFPGLAKIVKAIYLKINPPPPPPPTVRYGKLPKIEFPTTSAEATPEYKLETIQGGLPKLPNTARAYVVGINKSRLLTLERVKQKVLTLGFLNEPTQTDEQTYLFTHPKVGSRLSYNVVSGSFSYNYDWTRDKDIPTAHDIPIGTAAIEQAKSFLNSVGSLSDDLVSGNGKFVYLVASGSAVIPTDSVYDANFVRVDLFRSDKDKMPIVTVGGDTSPIEVMLSGLPEPKRVIQANFQYSQVLDNDFATYPLITVQQAWNQLVAGQAFIAKRTLPNVTVRKVSLAYFESNQPQKFLQPVYLFEGDGGFMAYVPAVDPKFISE
jgi:hypothetical protein